MQQELSLSQLVVAYVQSPFKLFNTVNIVDENVTGVM